MKIISNLDYDEMKHSRKVCAKLCIMIDFKSYLKWEPFSFQTTKKKY